VLREVESLRVFFNEKTMNIKDSILLILVSLVFGCLIIQAHPTIKDPISLGKIEVMDTIKPQDTIVDVNGKNALFIGDSHTSNHTAGWQTIVCKKTKLKMKNVSVSGKTTYWMLEMALYSLHKNIDYCFIYGGANDMYSSSITPEEAVNNIQGIIKMCDGNGVQAIVLTGFDPRNTNTPNSNYIPKYIKFQKLLLSNIKGAIVIDTRVVAKSDCWDGLCHMAPSGHKKIGECVIKKMKFKTY